MNGPNDLSVYVQNNKCGVKISINSQASQRLFRVLDYSIVQKIKDLNNV